MRHLGAWVAARIERADGSGLGRLVFFFLNGGFLSKFSNLNTDCKSGIASIVEDYG